MKHYFLSCSSDKRRIITSKIKTTYRTNDFFAISGLARGSLTKCWQIKVFLYLRHFSSEHQLITVVKIIARGKLSGHFWRRHPTCIVIEDRSDLSRNLRKYLRQCRTWHKSTLCVAISSSTYPLIVSPPHRKLC